MKRVVPLLAAATLAVLVAPAGAQSGSPWYPAPAYDTDVTGSIRPAPAYPLGYDTGSDNDRRPELRPDQQGGGQQTGGPARNLIPGDNLHVSPR